MVTELYAVAGMLGDRDDHEAKQQLEALLSEFDVVMAQHAVRTLEEQGA